MTGQRGKPRLGKIAQALSRWRDVRAGGVQVGVLPWRRAGDGLDLMLITSSRRQRWIVPKGWPMAGKNNRESACQEAFEEAGIRGQASAEPFGSFVIDKLEASGESRLLTVLVYPLEVTEELAAWPESDSRQRRWFSADEAVATAAVDSLRELIRAFAATARVGG